MSGHICTILGFGGLGSDRMGITGDHKAHQKNQNLVALPFAATSTLVLLAWSCFAQSSVSSLFEP